MEDKAKYNVKQQKKKLSYNEFFKEVAKNKEKLAEINGSFDTVLSFLGDLLKYTIMIREQRRAEIACYYSGIINDLQSLMYELSIYKRELN